MRTWNKRIKELKAYKRKHGHCNVPNQCPKNPALGAWVSNVRASKKQKSLAEERIRQLEAMGFSWSLRSRSVWRYDWDSMLAALVDFKNRHGHCNVPYDWHEPPGLGRWLSSVRGRQKTGSLSPKQSSQLEKLGGTRESQWQEMYLALVKYQKKHGECEVLSRQPNNQELVEWVTKQRSLCKRNLLSKAQIRQLDKIGFIWESAIERRWERMYSALEEYKKKCGRSWAHPDSEEHRKLTTWVHSQRKRRRAGTLSKRHGEKLDILGFNWGVSWEETLEELIQYKEQYGNCDVSVTSKRHAKLARFVLRHKMAKRDGTLRKDREKRLK
ncbi:MAG: Helicase associated domain protein, partial [Candidatus Nealsonbacteria bacterium]|nr:Helicase associated domain protein [Candidatus Nealsonbacteria bacterium]